MSVSYQYLGTAIGQVGVYVLNQGPHILVETAIAVTLTKRRSKVDPIIKTA